MSKIQTIMNSEETRNKIITNLENGFSLIFSAFNKIPSDAWQTNLGEGWEWTPHDLLAHMVGWEIEFIEGAKNFKAGKPPQWDIYEDDEVNARYVKRFKDTPTNELLDMFKKKRDEFIQLIKAIGQEEFKELLNKEIASDHLLEDGTQHKWTFEEVVSWEWHEKEHTKDIETFLQNQS